jgi:hypothetical protein
MVSPTFISQQEFLVFVALLILVIELLLAIFLIRMHNQLRKIRSSLGPDVPSTQDAGLPASIKGNVIQVSGHVPDLDRNLDISENMHRILDRYQLQRFTIVTDDGLVVASSGASADHDAAAMSHLYRSWGGSDTHALTIFAVPHKGTPLVGIVRRSGALSEVDLEGIKSDAGLIISWYT